MPTPEFNEQFKNLIMLHVNQRFEPIELLGIESRNKYEIHDSQKNIVAYAAEQQKGFLGIILRQILGHWRSFEIYIFDSSRKLQLVVNHPFRLLFQRLELSDEKGRHLGAIQQRFAILSKKFDLEDQNGKVIFSVRSPIWRIWTFPVYKGSEVVAKISKQWAKLLTEVFSDRDRFWIEFNSPNLSVSEKQLLMAAALFVDLQYFENKSGD